MQTGCEAVAALASAPAAQLQRDIRKQSGQLCFGIRSQTEAFKEDAK